MMAAKVLKNTFIYVLLGFLSPALNFLLLPIYTRTLTKTDFSIIALSVILQSLFINLIGGGLNGAYYRYYFEYKKNNEVASLFMTLIGSVTFSLLVWLGVMMLIGDVVLSMVFSNSEFTFKKYGWMSLTIAGLMNINQLILSKYRNEEKASIYAAISISTFLLSAALIYIGVVVLKGGAYYSLLGRMLGLLTTTSLFVVIFIFRNAFSIRLEYLKNMFGYSRNIMFYLMLTFLYQNIDKYMVERKFDFQYLGMYGFGISLVSLVEIFVASMNNAMKPRIYKLWKEGSDLSVQEKVRLHFRLMMIFLSIIWFGLLLSFPLANKLLFNNLYTELYVLLPAMAINMIWRIYYIVYAEPIFFNMYTSVLPKITFATFAISLALLVITIPYIGIWGVILAASASNFIKLIMVVAFSKSRQLLPVETFCFPKEHLLFAIGLVMAVVFSIVFHFKGTEWGVMFSLAAIPFVLALYFILYFREAMALKSQFAMLK